MRAAVTFALGTACAAASSVELVSFEGQPATTFTFKELNDPVMGGQSSGTWQVMGDSKGKFGVFDGTVATVPSLHAPGFIKAAADGHFPDASGTLGGDLVLEVRTQTPGYKGFRASFASGAMSAAYSCAGGGSLPFSRGCFKAKFSVPAGSEFTEVRIPFTSFSDKWSPATGEQTATCAKDSDVCPTAQRLAAISRVEVWAEGANGKVHLEVRSIRAEGASHSAAAPRLGARPPAQYDTCKKPVQDGLLYGIAGRTTPDIPVAVDPNETLAEAVCCDSRTKVYAEPQFLYQAPDINLFAKLKSDGITTFYDSVCGVPLFRAPVGRSFADFKADTDEHGWPSFRKEEVNKDHVTFDKDGFVYSSCGTHLGSYLPDDKGPRWCMDLSCIAGRPVHTDSRIIV